jgi:hypothetical protein
MKSTSEEISKIAKDFLEKNEIEYISLDEPKYEVAQIVPNEPKVNIWSVNYEYKVFDVESAYVIIDDFTKKIIHILHKHGYSYPNGVKEIDNYEDDGEDWNEDI